MATLSPVQLLVYFTLLLGSSTEAYVSNCNDFLKNFLLVTAPAFTDFVCFVDIMYAMAMILFL